jgi:hypothetical protein
MTAVQDHPQLHEASAVEQPAGETSMLGRSVALLTPVFVVAAGWVAVLSPRQCQARILIKVNW